MSFLFSCRGLTKSYGAQTLFSDLSLVINSGDRVGLIGPNGSGKSTLLKIISGMEQEDHGTIQLRRQCVVSYLAQESVFHPGERLVDHLLPPLEPYGMEPEQKRARVQTLLSRAEFADENLEAQTLSGGWRKRLSICRALVNDPDLLVMDEPTNHLDLEGILWLEKLLAGTFKATPAAFIIVSHDRQFLENSVNRVVELSRSYPEGAFQVMGSYATFLEERERFLSHQGETEERLANKVRRETEWLRRGPKARTSKARYRIDAAHRLMDELDQVKMRNRAGGSVSIDFSETGIKTKKLIQGTNLAKRYGEQLLFKELDILLSPGSKIGLLGRNGCGKSSLIEILGSAADSSGGNYEGSLATAEGVSIVQFDQDRSSLDPSQTLRRALAPDGDAISFQGRTIHVVSWAKRFLFRPDQLETPVGQLSGGEQARILIASLMRQPADILLLDEPTNDLDIGSLDVLEESLLEFSGALVLVTHDRYLLDRVCDRVIGFIGEGRVHYYSDYEQWLRAVAKQEGPDRGRGETRKKRQDPVKSKPAGRLSYNDQREYDTIELRIMEAEAERDRLEQEIQDPQIAADLLRLQERSQKLEQCNQEVDLLYERWEILERKKAEGG